MTTSRARLAMPPRRMSILQSNSAPRASRPIDVVVVGAGMFTRDVILPSLYHLQRCGEVGSISVAATSIARLGAARR